MACLGDVTVVVLSAEAEGDSAHESSGRGVEETRQRARARHQEKGQSANIGML